MLAFPTYPNYDSLMALVWGRDVLDGTLPAFDAYRAPTQHPLLVALGIPLSALGDTGERLMVLFGVAGYLGLVAGVYRLGRATIGVWGGLVDGRRTLVSRASGEDGAVAASDAYEPSVSRDGTVVAFTSRARNLGGASRRSSVYVRDLRTNTTRWISSGVAGDAVEPAISSDGRYVAFVARAGFLGGTILSLRSNVWLHDRAAGRTTLVSRATGERGAAGNGYASEPDVSADGSLVAFASTSGNLVRGKARGLTGVFVRDVAAATTTLLSDHRSGGRAAAVVSAREPGSSWALCPLGPLTHGAA